VTYFYCSFSPFLPRKGEKVERSETKRGYETLRNRRTNIPSCEALLYPLPSLREAIPLKGG